MVAQKTTVAKPGEVEQKWFVVDATDRIVGRLASEIAVILMGKNRPTYTPHVDTGDYVIVINASKVNLTGGKIDSKKYHRYSGYPGGLRSIVARTVRDEDSERMIRQAVKGMLPKNRLGRKMLKKLKIYAGSEHPHEAQKPELVDLGTGRNA